jgi:hypothetical protein
VRLFRARERIRNMLLDANADDHVRVQQDADDCRGEPCDVPTSTLGSTPSPSARAPRRRAAAAGSCAPPRSRSLPAASLSSAHGVRAKQ